MGDSNPKHFSLFLIDFNVSNKMFPTTPLLPPPLPSPRRFKNCPTSSHTILPYKLTNISLTELKVFLAPILASLYVANITCSTVLMPCLSSRICLNFLPCHGVECLLLRNKFSSFINTFPS